MHTGCVIRTLVLSCLAIVPHVAGHGYLSQVTVDGRTYQGNAPNANGASSPIRHVSDVGPVKGANNTFLLCGLDAQLAPEVADAMPGSNVSFKWSSISGGNWIHEIGPILTYLASCGTSGCTTFNASSAQWFKIAQDGRRTDGTWAMKDLYDGQQAIAQLPTNLASGDYLIRNELIALHAAMAPGGAEFYPSCTQLRVGGSATGVPETTVSFPGAYNDTDSGILVDAYDMGSAPYVFPGPSVSALVVKGLVAGDGGSDNSTTITTTSEPSETTTTIASSASSETTTTTSSTSSFETTTTSTTSAPSETATVVADSGPPTPYELLIYPRRISRVMYALP